jgi:nitrogenase-associated protein
MTAILFYEKPGCINNTRQKRLLQEAGYDVDARNLLTEPWTRERLAPYFIGLPVAQWFNRSAPMITGGEIVPELVDEESAWEMLLQEPLLIRRPLMQIGDHYLVGFEEERVNQVLALNFAEQESGELEHCPRFIGHSCDEAEA